MKKKLIVLVAILAFAMAISVTAIAATTKATLINSLGDKVVVAVNSTEAQHYFGLGYVLMGQPIANSGYEPNYDQCVTCPSVGSAAGNTFDQKVNFYNTFVDGGKILDASSSLMSAMTLTAGQVCNNKYIHVNSGATPTGSQAAASLNITLPATSTLYADCLKNEGDSISFLFKNSSPTAATTTELVAGTGCITWIDDAGGDHDIPGLSAAEVTIYRVGNSLTDVSNVTCMVKVHQIDPTT